jgi:hypothetical protein
VLPTDPEFGLRIRRASIQKLAAPSIPLLSPTLTKMRGPLTDWGADAVAENEPAASAVALARTAEPTPLV